MINSSLNNLVASHYFRSPLISLPYKSSFTDISIKNTQIFRSFSHFIFSKSPSATILAQKSVFKSSLEAPIYISSKKYKRKVINSQIIGKTDILTCIQCQFINCGSKNSEGGSIYSECPTELFDCKFTKSFAKNGGAIFIKSSFKGDELNFDRTESVESCGAASFQGDRDIELNRTIFIGCEATTFGCFSKYSGDYQRINNINVTNCAASLATAAFEVGITKGKYSYAFISNNFISGKNPGASIYACTQFSVDHCCFNNLSTLYKGEQGYALWVDYEATIAIIMKSTFRKCRGEGGKVVFVKNSRATTIYRCCFDVERNEATNNAIVDDHSLFNVKEGCPKYTQVNYVDPKEESLWMGYASIVLFAIGALMLLNKKQILKLLKMKNKKC